MKKFLNICLLMIFVLVFSGCTENKTSDIKINLFSNGLAIAVNSEGLYGFFDSTYQIVIDFIYEYTEGFNDGIALVEKDNKEFLINTKGDIITEKYDYIHYDYIKKIYICENSDTSKSVLLNKNGKVLCSYEYIDRFHNEPYAAVVIDKDNHGFINAKGELVFSGAHEVSYFVNGYSMILDENGDYWTINTKFEKLYNFGKNRISVYGFIVVSNDKYYDVYGKYYCEKINLISGSYTFGDNYYTVGNGLATNFYSLDGKTKILGINDHKYMIIDKYIIIFDNNTINAYNSNLEIVDSVIIEDGYSVYFYNNKDSHIDYYRKNIYLDAYSSLKKQRKCYMFNYEKAKFERKSYLDDYNISHIYKDYICILKDDLYGLISLDGEVVFDTKSKFMYVATEDGYFINSKECIIYNQKKEVLFESKEWYGIGLNYYNNLN